MPSPVTFNTAARRASESEYPEDWAGLVASWSAIEGGGRTAFDFSGRGRHGTLSTGTTWSTGKAGHALSFGGVGDSVALNSSAILTAQPKASLAAWIWSNSVHFGAIYSEDVVDGIIHGLYTDVSNQITAVISQSNSAFQYTTGPAISAGAWYFVSLVLDALTPIIRLYLNGVQVATNTAWNGTFRTGVATVNIGDFTNPGTFGWDGLIDDVRVYSRALTASEIRAMYDRGPKSHLIPRRRRSSFGVTLSAGGVWVPINQSIMVGGGIL